MCGNLKRLFQYSGGGFSPIYIIFTQRVINKVINGNLNDPLLCNKFWNTIEAGLKFFLLLT